MAISRLGSDNVPIELWTRASDLEEGAIKQLKNIASLPWCFHHVAVMPDVHLGKGATVGSAVAMKGAGSPAAVGVDTSCGRAAVQTNLTANDLPGSLGPIRSAVEAAIPVGFSEHHEPAFGRVSEPVKREVQQLFREWKDLTPAVRDLDGKAKRQVGTLG